MKEFLHYIQHHGNALHVYSGLCRIMNPRWARQFSYWYEGLFHPVLYRREYQYGGTRRVILKED